MESKATCAEESILVLACDGQSGDEADVGVGFHHTDEVGAGDGFDGAGGKGLCAHAVESVLIQGGKAEDIAGGGDPKEEKTARAGRRGDFDATGAEDVEVIGG